MKRKNKQFFRDILDSFKDVVLVKNKKSQLVWANQAFLDCYGMDQEQLIGITDGAQSDPDDTLQYVRDDKYVWDNNEHLNIPSEAVTSHTGEVSYVHTIKSPVCKGSKVQYTVGVSRQINNLRVNSQKLTHLDTKTFSAPIRQFIDMLPSKVIMTDHYFRSIKSNRSWDECFGAGDTEFVFECSPEFPYLKNIFDKALSTGQSIDCGVALNNQYFNLTVSTWSYPDKTIGGLLITANNVTELKKSEKRFNDLYRQYKSFYENTPAMLHSVNTDSELELVSNTWLKKLGYDRKEVIGKKPIHLLTNESQLKAQRISKNFFSVEYSGDTSFQLIKKDGGVLDVIISVSCQKDEFGNVLRSLATLEDITNLKKKEKLLIDKSREIDIVKIRNELALQTSSTGIWEWNLDTNEVIWDEKMFELYGINKENFSELYEAWEKSLHPEDKDRVIRDIQYAIKSNSKLDTQFRVIKNNGKVAYIRAFGEIFIDERCSTWKMIGVNWDRTSFINLEKENEVLSSAIIALDDITDGWWDWDLKTNDVFFSPKLKSMLGYSNDEIPDVFASWGKITSPNNVDSLNRNFDKHLRSKASHPFNQVLECIHKNGSYVYVICRGKAIADKHGKFYRMIGTHTDITTQKTQEFELQKSNKELENFAYIASHDLREPLRGIESYTHFLHDEYTNSLDSKAKHYLQRMLVLTKRLDGYLVALLKYSRLGREKSSYEDVNISKLIDDCVQLYLNPENVNRVLINIQDGIPNIHCSSIRLKKVFGNLISNAVKYCDKENIKIDINYKRLSALQHLFLITDNGIGIDSKSHEKIFVLFRRLNGKDRYGTGSGIGLTIAKKAVSLLGGDLWVEHSEVGKGSTFAFSIVEKVTKQ